MTSTTLAQAIGRVIETDSVAGLSALVAELRRAYPGDAEADTVARQAELKMRRLVAEG